MSTGGAWSWGGVPGPGDQILGGAWSGRVSAPRGVPGLGGCLLLGGGGLVETPPDGYCCGRYASYWNAFLFGNSHIICI